MTDGILGDSGFAPAPKEFNMSSPVNSVFARVTRSALILATCVVTCTSVPMAAASLEEAFPDEWFFDGANRPQTLRAMEGSPAPEIDAAEWIGDEVEIADLRGKVVVVDFWATWCGPCMAAIPKNIELVNELEDEGLVFIGMHDANNGWDSADKVVNEQSINYPVALDRKSSGGSGISTAAYNVAFWPTYIVIDRAGNVRGAGLIPSFVDDAVRQLLAEPWSGSGGSASGEADAANTLPSFPADWFFGAEKRPESLRVVEGRRAPKLTGDHMLPAKSRAVTDGRVRVVQFVQPGVRYSVRAWQTAMEAAAPFVRQGATLITVGDTRTDWEAIQALAGEVELEMTFIDDSEAELLPETESMTDEERAEVIQLNRMRKRGALHTAFGAIHGPTTVVIDRAGRIRAAGLRPERLPEVINTLMAERLETPTASPTKSDSETSK